MILRIVGYAIAAIMLALGVISAATKAGLFGPPQTPTRVFVGPVAMTLPAQWRLDQGEFAAIRNDLCGLLHEAPHCAAYFVKGLGSPRAVLAIAAGPNPAPADLTPQLVREGSEASRPASIKVGQTEGQRYRVTFKKRGRFGSLALVDVLRMGSQSLILEVIAEEPEGRYQEAMLAEIEKTLTVLDK